MSYLPTPSGIAANPVTANELNEKTQYFDSTGENDSIILGKNAVTEESNTIAIGTDAAALGTSSIAIGHLAGQNMTASNEYNISIGESAANSANGTQNVVIGDEAFEAGVGNNNVVLGFRACETNTSSGSDRVMIGSFAGNGALSSSVAIGAYAVNYAGGQHVTAIGNSACRGESDAADPHFGGSTNYSTGFGAYALQRNAGVGVSTAFPIAMGLYAGRNSANTNSISIGVNAGQTSCGQYAIALGTEAGKENSGDRSISIGYQAHETSSAGDGDYAINIGYNASATTAYDKTIVLNASGTILNPDRASALFINPIRGVAHGLGLGVLHYDTSTKEITYSTT